MENLSTETVELLKEALPFSLALADKANELSLQWFRKTLDIDLKSDDSPVTIADRNVEKMLRSTIEAQYPGHGLLGEEFGRERLDAEHVWVVDPIDGTRSFITGSPLWGCLIGLMQHNRPVLGLVEVPATGERWYARRGDGAHFRSIRGEEQRCEVSRCESLAAAKLYTTSPYYFDAPDSPAIESLLDSCAVARFGGDCYNYGLLASGHIDLVVESQLQPFDYLPLVTIVEEAGGIITDWQGQPLTTASDGRVVAAATASLHREVLHALNV
ncbi:histidinol-phosphatase [Marinobacterium lutimaris]|uniref:Histidinol-phosphatase n=1 Tax=Marinobacterium lutimaris TaxID=568106 RepID=A0A1H6D7N2_9GAMM|nr:histidinol-phosphatase [Marinobacterium lutimaris]SEG81078.1 myo-inositol-1(or 4)-monophosphatase [Marinobacterium lutimaris]